MKMLVKSQFQKLDYNNLWQTFITKAPYKDNFKDVLKLVEIVLVLPISAAQCERAVSAQNRIKDSVRSSLSTSMLEDLNTKPCYIKKLPWEARGSFANQL